VPIDVPTDPQAPTVRGGPRGLPAGSAIGSYRIVKRLGQGGMGVVYRATDEHLRRDVAIKVLHPEVRDLRGKDSLLAEARAMAQLSHVNVVTVFEAGTAGDELYIAMELVHGQTLRAWLKAKRRPWREIVAVFRQAGAGLAAAHLTHLVHRDFKPDNVLIDASGRARVTDFGLAAGPEAWAQSPSATTPDLAYSTGIAGTPGYLAPEIYDGEPADARADQFAFCVSLWEALTGKRPFHGDHLAELRASIAAGVPVPARSAPAWLLRVVARGLADRREDRYPSMADLLRQLERDPARTRRRVLLGTAAIATAGGAVALALVLGRPADCAGAAELAGPWSPAARTLAIERIAGLGPYGRALAPQLEQALNDHATRWAAGHRDACLAHRSGAQSDALLDRRMACLDRGRAALAEVADITDRADASTLPEIARAVRAIPDPAACSDIEALLSDVAPPPQQLAAQISRLRDLLARARVQIAAGRFREARSLAARCTAEARSIDYRPLLAEALLTEGHAIMMVERAQAVPVLVEATNVAVQAGADTLAVEAWARRAWAQGTDAKAERTGALGGLELVEALAARTPSARFARALLHNNVGGVDLAEDRRDRARAAFELAVSDSRGLTGPGTVELIAARSNLALVTDDPARSDALFADAVAELTRLLGADHPDTLRIRALRGTTSMIRLAPAAEVLTPVCEGYALHEGLGPLADRCWAEVAYIRSELGDDARAAEAMERAVHPGTDDAQGVVEAPYVALWRGDARGAEGRFAAALAAMPPKPDDPWWYRARHAQLQLGLGRARRALGDLRGARPALESSAAELEAIARDHPAAALERRLGRARAELAMTLAALGAKKEEVAPVAAAASAWLRRAEGRAAEIEALGRLAAAR
jgi:tetratricopeptide (TPR) repeat protein